jgi:Ca-activated chloride channel family protein
MLNNWNILFWEYDFLSPHWLWLLLFVPVFIFRMWKIENRKEGEVKFSRTEEEQNNIESVWISDFRKVFIGLYAFVAVLIIFALAKPYDWNSDENINESYKNGIDIVIAMDVSMSMLARDFEPNRMEASKVVAKEFIDGRKVDRIGLVVFAGEAYTACPTTLDYSILKDQIDKVTGENLEPGTAIGTGLGTAVSRLRNDSLPSKVVILLTDGSNCAGEVTPDVAAELAKSKNVRVYTIGMGTNGEALSPIITPFGIRYENVPVEIDEKTLNNIAVKTGGKYFRATDKESLQVIYKEIENLEKHKILDQEYKSDPPASPAGFLNWAILIAVLTWSVKSILFRTNE